MSKKKIIGIHENLPYWKAYLSQFQHLTAMFGATIVPILLGVDPLLPY
jgi:uracil permease